MRKLSAEAPFDLTICSASSSNRKTPVTRAITRRKSIGGRPIWASANITSVGGRRIRAIGVSALRAQKCGRGKDARPTARRGRNKEIAQRKRRDTASLIIDRDEPAGRG